MNSLIKYVLLILCLLKISIALVDVTVDQDLLNSGFHRLLKTNITLYGNLTSCKLLVEEKFPRNFLVVKEELDNTNYNIYVTLSQKLDLESTASTSNPFSLYIYLNKSLPISTSLEYHSEYFYILPVHIRYHDPKVSGGYREFKKQPAVLFAHCPSGTTLPSTSVVKLSCDPDSNHICEWSALSFTQKNLLPQLRIPVGNMDLHQTVLLSTHIIAYAAVIFILYNLFPIK